jgi:hypothetical protein
MRRGDTLHNFIKFLSNGAARKIYHVHRNLRAIRTHFGRNSHSKWTGNENRYQSAFDTNRNHAPVHGTANFSEEARWQMKFVPLGIAKFAM